MKFYHVADVHLGAVPDRGMPWSTMREKDMFESFYRLLAQAHRERIDAVLICGDLFHRQPLKKELKELAYYFEKAAPVKIFIIAGNHDYISAESNYVNFPWSSNVIFIASGSAGALSGRSSRCAFTALAIIAGKSQSRCMTILLPGMRPHTF